MLTLETTTKKHLQHSRLNKTYISDKYVSIWRKKGKTSIIKWHEVIDIKHINEKNKKKKKTVAWSKTHLYIIETDLDFLSFYLSSFVSY